MAVYITDEADVRPFTACPLCFEPLDGELYFHGECATLENGRGEWTGNADTDPDADLSEGNCA